MPEFDFLLDEMQRNYASAVAAKDRATLMQLYDPNVRVFDAWECWSYEGAAAWGRSGPGLVRFVGRRDGSSDIQ